MAVISHDSLDVDTKASPPITPCEQCLTLSDVFSDLLRGSDVAVLKESCATLRVAKGALLLGRGLPHDSLMVLNEGFVRLARSHPDGNRQILSFFSAGDILSYGDHSVVWDGDLEAVVASRVCVFSAEKVKALRDRYPILDQRLIQRAHQHTVRAHKHISDLGRTSAVQRVAALILELGPAWQCADGQGDVLDLPMGRAEIADYLILQTETVSRSFQRLVSMGVIDLPRPTRIEVRNRELLEALANGTRDYREN